MSNSPYVSGFCASGYPDRCPIDLGTTKKPLRCTAHPVTELSRCGECGRKGCDPGSCDSARDARRDANPIHVQIESCYADAAESRRQEALAQTNEITGFCGCCGEPVDSPTEFRLGHSQRLRMALLREAEDGDMNALVELLVRGWPLAYARSKSGISVAHDDMTEASEEAEAIIDRVAWIRTRNLRRRNA